MTIKERNIYTVRELIEEKREHLLSIEGKWNWKIVKAHWTPWFGEGFNASAESVFEVYCSNQYDKSILCVDIICELCDNRFDLDEEFIVVWLDRGGYDDVHISCHKECLKKIGE
jgi:hypothetical protein